MPSMKNPLWAYGLWDQFPRFLDFTCWKGGEGGHRAWCSPTHTNTPTSRADGRSEMPILVDGMLECVNA
jgi:hypothetical protein